MHAPLLSPLSWFATAVLSNKGEKAQMILKKYDFKQHNAVTVALLCVDSTTKAPQGPASVCLFEIIKPDTMKPLSFNYVLSFLPDLYSSCIVVHWFKPEERNFLSLSMQSLNLWQGLKLDLSLSQTHTHIHTQCGWEFNLTTSLFLTVPTGSLNIWYIF